MSALKIAPALHTAADRHPNHTPLLTHSGTAHGAQAPKSAQDVHQPDPVAAPIRPGADSHIQAQILASAGYRSFRRPTTNGPRDAVRAYAQTRRRPGAVSAAPRLQAII
ncbi:hypothetical protein SAMN04515647_0956 [Cohaesibacter sp. ES.047]|uniref:hypothetical protein n=1 Tax=Cohaesibacter sp. ES.047 TaxID=1798205 RepID=UPI000BB7F8D6|nr:hypothetical protein [Cohaesibacter sp. ES.047]SNY90783.1 hypothetical protein SAMN04515647_0956 [Cohaesibacter sp. ES.047]